MRLIHPDSVIARQTRTDWLLNGAVLVVFILVAVVSTLEKALGVSVTFGMLATLVQAKWSSRRDPRLWALIGIVGTAQLAAIFLVQIPRLSAGIVAVPFAVVEGLALWGLVNWMERRLPRT